MTCWKVRRSELSLVRSPLSQWMDLGTFLTKNPPGSAKSLHLSSSITISLESAPLLLQYFNLRSTAASQPRPIASTAASAAATAGEAFLDIKRERRGQKGEKKERETRPAQLGPVQRWDKEMEIFQWRGVFNVELVSHCLVSIIINFGRGRVRQESRWCERGGAFDGEGVKAEAMMMITMLLLV